MMIDVTDTTDFILVLVNEEADGKWDSMLKRELIIQRNVDVNQLNSMCDIIPLLQEVILMNTVENVRSDSKLLTSEFYCNLTN